MGQDKNKDAQFRARNYKQRVSAATRKNPQGRKVKVNKAEP